MPIKQNIIKIIVVMQQYFEKKKCYKKRKYGITIIEKN